MDDVWAILGSEPLGVRGPLERWRAARDRVERPVLAAVLAGHGAQTVGEVFFAGYQAAVERLLGERAVQALLVTESGGNHPGAVAARLQDGGLTGEKAFVLDAAEVSWVLASRGTLPDGRSDLVLARVEGRGERTPLHVGWLVDVPHSRVRFSDEPVGRVVEDAWETCVKPFRTVEDLGVSVALAAARVGASTRPEHEEAWMSLLVSLVGLWDADPNAAPTVRATAGSWARLGELSGLPVRGPLAASWVRDARLLDVAQRARAVRLERARRTR